MSKYQDRSRGIKRKFAVLKFPLGETTTQFNSTEPLHEREELAHAAARRYLRWNPMVTYRCTTWRRTKSLGFTRHQGNENYREHLCQLLRHTSGL